MGNCAMMLAVAASTLGEDLREKGSNMRIQALEVLIVFVAAAPAFGTVVAPDLKSAFSFGLLGGTVSNTGTSLVIGNVGATTTITGFPPGTATGTVYGAPSDPTVTSAYTDFQSA